MEGTISLNDTLKTTCPFCGKPVRLNDLLFCGKRLPLAADYRLAACLRDLLGSAPKDVPAHELLNWRDFCAGRVVVENGIVQGIRGGAGQVYATRACCWCHSVLPPELLHMRIAAIFGADRHREELRRCEAELDGLFREERLRLPEADGDSGIPAWRVGDCFGFAVSESETPGGRLRRSQALVSGSVCNIIITSLERPNELNYCVDEQAMYALKWIVDTYFSAGYTNRPALLLLLLPPEQPATQETALLHQSIMNYINNVFVQNQVCFWTQGAGAPRDLPEKLNRLIQA